MTQIIVNPFHVLSTVVALVAAAIEAYQQPQLDEDDNIIVPLFDEVHFTYEGAVIEVGSVLVVDTDACGKQIGRVNTICDNPFGEGMSAYVTWLDEDIKQPRWTTYLPLEIEVA